MRSISMSPSPGGRRSRAPRARALRPCSRLHERVGDMDEGQTRCGNPVEVFEGAGRSVEVKRVHQDPELGTVGRLDDLLRHAEIGNDGPWKELEHRANPYREARSLSAAILSVKRLRSGS